MDRNVDIELRKDRWYRSMVEERAVVLPSVGDILYVLSS